MAKHHEPFQSLGPIDWDSVMADGLPDFLSDTFAGAQTILDSIPVPAPVKAAASSANRRARSHTDPPTPSATFNNSLSARHSGASLQQAQDLMKEWKEVKVNARENPLSINVYKLASKDGRGAWFARRSVHDGLTFDKWKLGLEREFLESMKVQTGPGAGSIRGIGADKRVEHHVAEGAGKAEVYQLSAQFPGPTAPRDFVTLLLTAETPQKTEKKGGKRPLRSYIIVSKPCEHPECPPRQGIIRGQYESVEIIREVPTEKPPIRRSMSTVDIPSEETKARQSMAENMSREAVLRAAQKKIAQDDQRNRGVSVNSAPPKENTTTQDEEEVPEEEEEIPTTIEWLMVTRSDPGGNVPRFMIERGTPGGIVTDAGKFLKWLTSKAARDFPSEDDTEKVDPAKTSAVEAESAKARSKSLAPAPTVNLLPDEDHAEEQSQGSQYSTYEYPSSNGLYGMIYGAFGYASSAVAQRLPNGLPFFSSAANSSDEAIREEPNDKSSDSLSDISDTSSIRSFASAVERNEEDDTPPVPNRDDTASTVSDESVLRRHTLSAAASSHYERDLKKLQERRSKMQEKMARLQSRMTNKRADESQKDATTMSKLREKHDREMAKQEEKYKREMRRLEEKREAEERKASEKRKKQLEREERANINLELERARSERDLALQQVELLKAQVGELQKQNTRLVAEMGRQVAIAGAEGKGRRETLKRHDSTASAASAVSSIAGTRIPATATL